MLPSNKKTNLKKEQTEESEKKMNWKKLCVLITITMFLFISFSATSATKIEDTTTTAMTDKNPEDTSVSQESDVSNVDIMFSADISCSGNIPVGGANKERLVFSKIIIPHIDGVTTIETSEKTLTLDGGHALLIYGFRGTASWTGFGRGDVSFEGTSLICIVFEK